MQSKRHRGGAYVAVCWFFKGFGYFRVIFRLDFYGIGCVLVRSVFSYSIGMV